MQRDKGGRWEHQQDWVQWCIVGAETETLKGQWFLLSSLYFSCNEILTIFLQERYNEVATDKEIDAYTIYINFDQDQEVISC